MKKDSTERIGNPAESRKDVLTEVLREGARKLLADAVEAERAVDRFVETYEAKYPKATECLRKDRGALLTFYDFPAEHWAHIRTTNPIESTFATVRLRTARTKGCGSRLASLTMVFKRTERAERHWRRLNGSERLGEVLQGISFIDGIRKKAARLLPIHNN